MPGGEDLEGHYLGPMGKLCCMCLVPFPDLGTGLVY